eukprot:1128622-Prorocentrum_minimum.AAC.2
MDGVVGRLAGDLSAGSLPELPPPVAATELEQVASQAFASPEEKLEEGQTPSADGPPNRWHAAAGKELAGGGGAQTEKGDSDERPAQSFYLRRGRGNNPDLDREPLSEWQRNPSWNMASSSASGGLSASEEEEESVVEVVLRIVPKSRRRLATTTTTTTRLSVSRVEVVELVPQLSRLSGVYTSQAEERGELPPRVVPVAKPANKWKTATALLMASMGEEGSGSVDLQNLQSEGLMRGNWQAGDSVKHSKLQQAAEKLMAEMDTNANNGSMKLIDNSPEKPPANKWQKAAGNLKVVAQSSMPEEEEGVDDEPERRSGDRGQKAVGKLEEAQSATSEEEETVDAEPEAGTVKASKWQMLKATLLGTAGNKPARSEGASQSKGASQSEGAWQQAQHAFDLDVSRTYVSRTVSSVSSTSLTEQDDRNPFLQAVLALAKQKQRRESSESRETFPTGRGPDDEDPPPSAQPQPAAERHEPQPPHSGSEADSQQTDSSEADGSSKVPPEGAGGAAPAAASLLGQRQGKRASSPFLQAVLAFGRQEKESSDEVGPMSGHELSLASESEVETPQSAEVRPALTIPSVAGITPSPLAIVSGNSSPSGSPLATSPSSSPPRSPLGLASQQPKVSPCLRCPRLTSTAHDPEMLIL